MKKREGDNQMKHRVVAVLSIVALLTGMLAATIPVGAAPPPPDYRPVDVGPEVRQWEATRDRIAPIDPGLLEAAEAAADAAADAAEMDCVLDAKVWLSADFYNGGYFFDVFYLMADGASSQVWVQADLSWPEGDPRAMPVVTCDQAAYMVDQFDNNIYPTEIGFFGPPDFHDGSASLLEAWGYFPSGYYADTAGRQIVLVSNIQDANYYDPDYRIYTAGFYSPSFEAYFDRNVMSIDSYDWVNRVGPDGSRPYLYEGIFAHEYQHLLHDDYDPAEDLWINEGLADWAMDLCGYSAASSHLEDLINFPENSLVAWGDQGDLEILADYGLAYMYQEYMYEHYGLDFIQNEFQDGTLQGIASVDSVLAGLGATETFADTFHAFSAALYTMGAFSTEGLEDFQVNVGHPGQRNPEAYASPGAPPWGTDYYLLWGYEQIANFRFNGFEFNPLSWTSDGDVLWGGAGDLIDNWAIFEATGGGTLTFDTYFDIEDYWDFGFVQVSVDGGHTWTSLANDYTTADHDPDAHPTVVANLPGLTGWSEDWVTMSFDLSDYSGDILLAFRYVTDWATFYGGWYIDNVYVDDTLISDGSSTDAFRGLNEVLGIANDYTVTFIGERIRKGKPEYEVKTVMSGGYVSDWASIRQMFDNYRQLVMLVTYDAEQGVTSYADYTFEIDHKGGQHLK
jgi:immune inhibitor A